MHQSSKLARCRSIRNAASIAPLTLCDFLAPTVSSSPTLAGGNRKALSVASYRDSVEAVEAIFYDALSRSTRCCFLPTSASTTKRSLATFTTRPIETTISQRRSDRQARQKAVSWGQRRGISSTIGRHRLATVERPEHLGVQSERRTNTTGHGASVEANRRDFAARSRLPAGLFDDIDSLQKKVEETRPTPDGQEGNATKPSVNEQLRLLKSVRELEDKLAKAKAELTTSMRRDVRSTVGPGGKTPQKQNSPTVELSKEDYKNLVDLYYYTHRSRFDPESSDLSPTPTFLEDYSFKLSEDFAPPQAYAEFYDADEEGHESPLKEVEQRLKSRQLREISVTSDFIDLLLDERSSNAALFQAYKRLPQPGVSFLPRGIIRVFLQRMATPWQKSEKSMIRYLSLIDDMQNAGLPITKAEWASAIYLAGRSFTRVTESDMVNSFRVWKQMEQEAGVKAHHVTFNILFDIAVRANKYTVAQMVLKEMHDRGLRLNRLGRVSVIYFHGLRGDGDAVRKAYRDFVDAGEIVDTLVLNCVIASLFNAQEPAAAEQIYERMKSLQLELRRGKRRDGRSVLYRHYPGPGSEVIEHEMAANALGRTLLFASRLKQILPEHHEELQNAMPLTPDHTTFRTMISYHVNVSGNLDRITVLMDEMAKLFHLPYQSITFQLLFKGFALHGATSDPDATWSVERLDLVWDACRRAIKEGQAARRRSTFKPSEPTLPSIHVVNNLTNENEAEQGHGHDPQDGKMQKGLKRMSAWNDFVLDLALFPKERRKHIERVHAELFDEEKDSSASASGKGKPSFLRRNELKSSSALPYTQQQETYYPLGEAKYDQEEGEYVLPPPSAAIDPTGGATHEPSDESPWPMGYNEPNDVDPSHQTSDPETQHDTDHKHEGHQIDEDAHDEIHDDESTDTDPDTDIDPESRPIAVTSPYQVQATRPLVCWLLRAYTRCTGSRTKVEEVWNSVRKVWKTRDPIERENVVRVLRRCLRDCDRFGPPL
ncbi:hypothetical protein A1O1_08338 [Capronia coronata CBS 617.96]|uniref:Pentacotripeptide-repeat region of PRORP domain-containing protein n=1 Tax=Capronia coronata CBS 617.96 TaxID=1182541 RepID=W9XT70_9EURO|nr:uncharacterized protein A1O1_08338 [Capronia coronata CBS 617.96]EXJ80196.1 hypothetical protein A1O1_08338 [Capronia coronata CBS 617.96]